MNPDIETRLRRIEAENTRLREVVERMIEERFKTTFDGFKGQAEAPESTTDITRTITIGDGSAEVLDYPDDFVLYRGDGKIGRLPFYNESRF